MNLNEFFNDLAANNSRNYKLDKLKENVNDEVLRLVISLALDPFTNFYQRKIPEYTRQRQTIPMRDVFPFLYQMCNRLVTGNAAIAHLSTLLGSVTEDNAEVIKRIVTKDLKCGVSISTANAVWPGLIREYPVMLCSPFEQKLVDKIKFPAYAQMKMDGMRFNAIVKDGAVEYRSRNGKEINLLGNLDEQFLAMADGGDYVFDGELMVMDDDSSQFMDRQTGNGILNKANKGTISDKEAAKVHASVWDMIPYVLFCDSYSDTAYATRFSKLESMVSKQNSKDKRVWLVTSTIVQTIEEATAIFEDYLSSGYEGIILKDGSGVWEDRRAKHQIKFKGELECDLKIVGTEPHKKKPEWLGAIICESADGIIKVNVGSGFNDTHRKTLKEKDILGKIVAIKYNARIKNKSGEESLFLPVFVEIREDKDSADSSKEVK
jgi:hypothetical protein